jgi:hypothetical protein
MKIYICLFLFMAACGSESQESEPQETQEECQKVFLDGSGFCVEEKDSVRSVEFCGPDSDDVFTICR